MHEAFNWKPVKLLNLNCLTWHDFFLLYSNTRNHAVDIWNTFIHAAILQFPAVHKKKPPRSGYRRTKINRKRFNICIVFNCNNDMPVSFPRLNIYCHLILNSLFEQISQLQVHYLFDVKMTICIFFTNFCFQLMEGFSLVYLLPPPPHSSFYWQVTHTPGGSWTQTLPSILLLQGGETLLELELFDGIFTLLDINLDARFVVGKKNEVGLLVL